MIADAGFGRWFLPGPSEVHPEVLAAMARPVIPPFGGEMAALREQLRQPLRDLFRTSQEIVVAASSATGFMEAAIRSGVEERVLVVISGGYGERFAAVAEACGKDVVRVMVHPGRTLEPEHLAQFLDGPEVDAVALVHSETCTGALAPLSDLAPVIRARKDVMILVDAASSIGGCPVETEQWGLDFVFAGSQKALALPPGLALGAGSPRLLARAKKLSGRGQYFDLVRLADASANQQPQAMPPLPQFFALAMQLGRIQHAGGIESRWRRHHDMLTLVEGWVLERPGLAMLAPEGRRSWTVSCLRLPVGLASAAVVTGMQERGWIIGQGWGGLQDSTIRIGHMGESSVQQVGLMLDALDEVLRAVGDGPTPPSGPAV